MWWTWCHSNKLARPRPPRRLRLPRSAQNRRILESRDGCAVAHGGRGFRIPGEAGPVGMQQGGSASPWGVGWQWFASGLSVRCRNPRFHHPHPTRPGAFPQPNTSSLNLASCNEQNRPSQPLTLPVSPRRPVPRAAHRLHPGGTVRSTAQLAQATAALPCRSLRLHRRTRTTITRTTR